MAGHSKFKNIQHRKGAQDKKRAKLFTRLVREILSSAQNGIVDPNHNPRLRTAIMAAKAQNLPKERIDKALIQASSPNIGDNFEEIKYEGYGIAGIAVIVEALTDNKNRTAAEVRSAFSKMGGNLGESGSVNFMFNRLGIIVYNVNSFKEVDPFSIAVDVGAEDVENNEEYQIFYTASENLNEITNKLSEKYGPPEEYYLGWRALDFITTDEDTQAEKIEKLIENLEDLDDVQRVFTNCK